MIIWDLESGIWNPESNGKQPCEPWDSPTPRGPRVIEPWDRAGRPPRVGAATRRRTDLTRPDPARQERPMTTPWTARVLTASAVFALSLAPAAARGQAHP